MSGLRKEPCVSADVHARRRLCDVRDEPDARPLRKLQEIVSFAFIANSA